jgi:hypothetical protein
VAQQNELALVRDALQHYAHRGSFRSFSEVEGTDARAEFRFVWFRDTSFRVAFDRTPRRLTFIDMLPGIPARSAMDRHLRSFVKMYTSTEVPEHRRVDPRRVQVKVVNRGGAVSLVFDIKAKDVAFGVRKAVHLVNDILQDFLNEGIYVQYNVDYFNLNPEMA